MTPINLARDEGEPEWEPVDVEIPTRSVIVLDGSPHSPAVRVKGFTDDAD